MIARYYCRDAVRLTHTPTGLTGTAERSGSRRNVHLMVDAAKSLLAAKLAKLKENPDWVEGSGVLKCGVGTPVIRTWVLDPYQKITDRETGKTWEFKPEMLNGQIDVLLRR